MKKKKTKSGKAADVCVLVSGGLDSCVLVAELAKQYRRVYPVFIRQGLHWEAVELRYLRRYLRAIQARPLTVLDSPVNYGNHWSMTSKKVPGAKSRDEKMYLPGRNLMLLSKAAVFCALQNIPIIAIGSLGHNPFPDATPKFFRDFARVAGNALNYRLKVIAPFRQLSKTQVIRRGRDLPLHLTFSCVAPQHGKPCGRCNKCAERQRAVAENER
ncbi:MAG: 7-cyano-7-deazaguanine synthase [Verrucomicrobiae bacterium]|nr:7-cyano-7-deazaguanine synthase [Verrucomicrobiae bacterium]